MAAAACCLLLAAVLLRQVSVCLYSRRSRLRTAKIALTPVFSTARTVKDSRPHVDALVGRMPTMHANAAFKTPFFLRVCLTCQRFVLCLVCHGSEIPCEVVSQQKMVLCPNLRGGPCRGLETYGRCVPCGLLWAVPVDAAVASMTDRLY